MGSGVEVDVDRVLAYPLTRINPIHTNTHRALLLREVAEDLPVGDFGLEELVRFCSFMFLIYEYR